MPTKPAAPSILTRWTLLLVLITSAFALTSCSPGTEELSLSRLFGDGMVIQRDVEVPVWGWGAPGSTVQVQLAADPSVEGASLELFSTEVDEIGRWRVTLPPRSAGGPYVLSVEGSDMRREVADIWVGDVWLCSGQSNMEWSVASSQDAEAEIAAATDGGIRHFAVPRSSALRPQADLAGGDWTVASPETVGDWTAVGYYFARELREHVDVPVGLVHASWGGSRIEPWMSAEALGFDSPESAAELLEEHIEDQEKRLFAAVRKQLGKIPKRDPGLKGGQAVWADPELDDSEWDEMALPGRWEGSGWPGLDGVVWFRYHFSLDAESLRALRKEGSSASVGLGKIDDSDEAWLNGRPIGGMDRSYDVPRVYSLPLDALQAGDNVVAVRVTDFELGGGIYGSDEMLFLELGDTRHSLAGPWRYRIGEASYQPEAEAIKVPTLLYNQMIHPMTPFPVRGVLWYQGESNAGPGDALAYRNLFQRLILDWRARRGQEDLPFLFVQLANFMQPAKEPSESQWALLRESQSLALDLPKTAQAVTIDIGDGDDVHPRNKQDVGRRLALAARHMVYEEPDLVWSGPTYREHRVEGDRVILGFDHVGAGLTAVGGSLQEFAVAGADRRFVWAEASIDGNEVVVHSPQVPEPVAVRYAWGDNPEKANFYNVTPDGSVGLPASPFRTDDFSVNVLADEEDSAR